MVEAFVPRDDDETLDRVAVRSLRADELVLSATVHDPDAQTITGQHVQISEAGIRLRPWVIRYLRPEQLDALAVAAGLAARAPVGRLGHAPRSMSTAPRRWRCTFGRREPAAAEPPERPLGDGRHRTGLAPGRLRPPPAPGGDGTGAAVPVLPWQRGIHPAGAGDLRARRRLAGAGGAQPLPGVQRLGSADHHRAGPGVRAGARQRHPRGAGHRPRAPPRLGRTRRQAGGPGHGRHPRSPRGPRSPGRRALHPVHRQPRS